MMRKPYKRTLADIRAAYATVQAGGLGKTRWVHEGASSRTVTIYEGASSRTVTAFEPSDGYRIDARPLATPCDLCHGDGQVCNECGLPGGECQCPDTGLPTPTECPVCGGGGSPDRVPALLRFHWWCMAQATKYDRPGYSVRAFLFDWAGGRAADLYRWGRR